MDTGQPSRRTADPPWAAFADGLAAMLFLFLLTTLWGMARLKMQAAEDVAAVPQTTEMVTRQKVAELHQCMTQNAMEGLEVYADLEDHSLAILVSPLWFDSCSTGVSEAGLGAVAAMRACVYSTLLEQKGERSVLSNYDAEIVFEGHTDSQGVGRGCPYPSNWELSGARAAAVLRRFDCLEGAGCTEKELEQAGNIGAVVRGLGGDRVRFSAVGMADTRPSWVAICRQLGDELCPTRGEPFPLEAENLVRWANEVDGQGSTARRRMLRRVDLRVDLRPRLLASAGRGEVAIAERSAPKGATP